MYKISIILIIAFSLVGCGREEIEKEAMFKVGQKVCVAEGDWPIGEIFKVSVENEQERNPDKKYIYYIKLHKPKLKGHVVVRHKLENIYEFIEKKVEEGE
jgi:hypothetical protein